MNSSSISTCLASCSFSFLTASSLFSRLLVMYSSSSSTLACRLTVLQRTNLISSSVSFNLTSVAFLLACSVLNCNSNSAITASSLCDVIGKKENGNENQSNKEPGEHHKSECVNINTVCPINVKSKHGKDQTSRDP